MLRPRIAVPEIDQNVKNYTAALYAAGAEPVVISCRTEKLHQQEYLDYSEFRIDYYDGLLIPGGEDICPWRYGQENFACRGCRDALDDLQFDILDRFVKAKKPVFGICRGLQIINVYFGGTMTQDIPTAEKHLAPKGSPKDLTHASCADAGCWITKLYGESFVHNSSHHQAVCRPGRGLVVDSRSAKDGVPESLHHESLPVYGVQWHPERMCLDHRRSDTVDGLPVLRFFCEICGRASEEIRAFSSPGIMEHMMGL